MDKENNRDRLKKALKEALKDDDYIDYDYLNSEFYIKIVKEVGAKNTKQMYYGSKVELGVCICSMVEQLIRNGLFDENEIKELIDMGIDNSKEV